MISWKRFPYRWPVVRWIPSCTVSIADLWCFLWCRSEHAGEHTVKWAVSSNVMKLMWRHCNVQEKLFESILYTYYTSTTPPPPPHTHTRIYIYIYIYIYKWKANMCMMISMHDSSHYICLSPCVILLSRISSQHNQVTAIYSRRPKVKRYAHI